MELRSNKRKKEIQEFFMSFLETIIKELGGVAEPKANQHRKTDSMTSHQIGLENNDKYNSDLTRKKIQKYSDFMYSHGYEQITPKEYLYHFYTMFFFEWLVDTDTAKLIGCSSYHLISKTEKEMARKCGSRHKYKNFSMNSKIHDKIDSIETERIPLLVYFFNYRYDLFEELQKEMNSVI